MFYKLRTITNNLKKIIYPRLIKKNFVSASTSTLPNVQFKTGDQLYGYTVKNVASIRELDCTAIHLLHKSGAEHLHVSRQDNDNYFSVALRTVPKDSTGIPHILEHMTLCGSERFPVRDPFFKMLNRSLSTFMNAFTGSDWTMYLFSTQNPLDYENLMSVYLDAVYYPKLRRLDFTQEGWRLEPENLTNPDSKLVFKGVVLNEMKGYFSDPSSIFETRCKNLLLPSSTYSVVSGGDPLCIPDLSLKILREFHSHHYHPNNSRFFTYGNFDLERQLSIIDGMVLNKFRHGSLHDTIVHPEVRWSQPKTVHITCPKDPYVRPEYGDITMSVTNLMTDVSNLDETYSLGILGELLVNGPKSPFYRALLESGEGLGSDFSPNTGFSAYERDSSFSVGLQRVKKENIDKVLETIDKTVDQIIEEGFEPTRIEAVLHKIELSLKHQAEKFGLNLLMALTSSWNHGADPVEVLQVNKRVDEFKRRFAKNPLYLQDQVKHYLKDNHHRLTLIMRPDQSYDELRNKAEQEKLEQIVVTLTPSKRAEIHAQAMELSNSQKQNEDLSCLPTLRLSDIDRKISPNDKIILQKHFFEDPSNFEAGNLVQSTIQPTNGLTYLRLLSSGLGDLSDHLIPYLPLFCYLVTKIGAGSDDYLRQAEKTELKTGGLNARLHICEHPEDKTRFECGILFDSFCLNVNRLDMFSLWEDIFIALHLDNLERLKNLITIYLSDADVGRVMESGHIYAMTHSASCLTPCSQFLEVTTGLKQLAFLKNLGASLNNNIINIKNGSEKLGDVFFLKIVNVLKEIASRVLSDDNLRLALNANSAESVDAGMVDCERLIGQIRKYGPVTSETNNNNLDNTQFSPVKREKGIGKVLDGSIITAKSEIRAHRVFEEIVYTEPNPNFKIRKGLNTHQEFSTFPVNYIAKSFPTVTYNHVDFPALQILARLMSAKLLHREIREIGGAYGGGASNQKNIFSMYSYRDPNFEKTLDAFTKAVSWSTKKDSFDKRDLDEAKLSVFSKVDSPVAPANRGMREFLNALDDNRFEIYRQKLLDVKVEDVRQVAENYLLNVDFNRVKESEIISKQDENVRAKSNDVDLINKSKEKSDDGENVDKIDIDKEQMNSCITIIGPPNQFSSKNKAWKVVTGDR